MDSSAHGMQASFASMEESTAEDWAIIGRHYLAFGRELPDRVLAHL
jgi:hypothetical protein